MKKIILFLVLITAITFALFFVDKNKMPYLQSFFYVFSIITSLSNLCILHL